MRLEDITNVLCLSCALMFFYVSSQPSCSNGWFGHQCKYKCRCNPDICDVNGLCTSHTCQGGWFGPACQYADLAYSRASVAALTDGNDVTCNTPNSGDILLITLRESFVFTWLRVHVRDQGSGALGNLSVTFLSNTNPVPCPVWRKYFVNKTILDIHCNLSQTINAIILAGQAVPNLCSVYVSGGRNVAVKERTTQSTALDIQVGGTTHSLDPSRAVDGNTNQTLTGLSCSHTDGTTSFILTLSRERSVHRYVIYNRAENFEARLSGFKLQSFSFFGQIVFVHQDTTSTGMPVYRFSHSPLLVKSIMIRAPINMAYLALCEVEIYGDSVCDAQHYGRDCEHSCYCFNNAACFVSTGACPSGCPAGFFGIGCLTRCSPNCAPSSQAGMSSCDNNIGACLKGCQSGSSGALCRDECTLETFGINCNESCSPKCAPTGQANVSSCNTKTGACLRGCQSGSSGALCRDECKPETFGLNCNESCSPNCAPSGQAGMSSCDNKTGVCLKGCQSGSSGALCRDECKPEMFGLNCKESCSPSCAPSGKANVSSCDNKTGVCLMGCQRGSSGALCQDECKLGTFGLNCNELCSPNCAPAGQTNVSSCDNKTGGCLMGCQSGSSGASCKDECKLETFGLNCNESCSPNCVPSGQANVSSCNNKNGSCLRGCQTGSSGATCQANSPKSAVLLTRFLMEIILGMCGLLVALFLLLFCFSRKGKPLQAEERAAVKAQHDEKKVSYRGRESNTSRETSV